MNRERTWTNRILLTGTVFVLPALVALFVLTNPMPASISGIVNTSISTQEILWASVDIAKPRFAEVVTNALTTPLGNVSTDPTLDIFLLPASNLPEVTETPAAFVMEIVGDDSVASSARMDGDQFQYSSKGKNDRWIDVNLSEQRVYAYEGDTLVNSFIASTGLAETPTVTGSFTIWIKVRIQDMFGPGYYLPNVPYVMYFYEDYGLHGTYWHNNFGRPMSRGCVNLTIEDASWLFNWASVGTMVNVHY